MTILQEAILGDPEGPSKDLSRWGARPSEPLQEALPLGLNPREACLATWRRVHKGVPDQPWEPEAIQGHSSLGRPQHPGPCLTQEHLLLLDPDSLLAQA